MSFVFDITLQSDDDLQEIKLSPSNLIVEEITKRKDYGYKKMKDDVDSKIKEDYQKL